MTSWLVDTFQMEPGWARGIGFFIAVIIAVIIVLALISIFVWVLRRIASTRALGGRSRQPRIAVMDAAALDARRRLILIRRDNVEHLILVGGPSDVVVEQNIVRGVPVSQSYPRQPAAGFAPPPMETPAVPAEPILSPAPPAPAYQPLRAAASQADTPRAPSPVRPSMPAAPAAAAPQSDATANTQAQPRAPMPPLPQRPAAPRLQPAAAPAPDAPSPPRRAGSPAAAAGSAVAAAGAAVAGLARRTGARPTDPATPGAEERAASRPMEAPARREPTSEPPVRRTLTPPSSGPAANARTAFPQPSATAAEPARRAPPVSGPAAAGFASTALSGRATPAAPPARDPAREASAAPEPAKKDPRTETSAARPAPASQPPEPARNPSGPEPVTDVRPVGTSSTTADIDTSLEDALLAELGGAASREPDAARKDPAITSTSGTESQDDTVAGAAEDAQTRTHGDDTPTKTGNGEQANGSDNKAGSASMDAIEDEMARLLNEISGSRKP